MLEILKQDKIFIDIKNKVDIEQNSFLKTQNKILEKQENIIRNKKLIEALKEENEQLESQIKQDSISENGCIDFSNLEQYSDNINSNNRKINIINNVISNQEKEIDSLLNTEYIEAERKLDIKLKELYSYLLGIGSVSLLNRETINRINIVYKFFRKCHKGSEKDFIIYLGNMIQMQLGDISLDELNIKDFNKAFNIKPMTPFAKARQQMS